MKEHKIKELLTLYEKLLGYEPPSWGKEISGAKRITDKGYTNHAVEMCYKHFKSQQFWQDKHLSLSYIASNIDAWALANPPDLRDVDLDEWYRENN